MSWSSNDASASSVSPSANPTSFKSLGLRPEITEVLESLGYKEATPIQEKAIPVILEGRDLLGQAQTGTGKTGAFAIPLLNSINVNTKLPQVLVLVPTRELAVQVSEAFQAYAAKLKGLRVVPIYGGQSMPTQLQALRKGAHVVVGTPGRIMDHLRRSTLQLSDLKSLVLDEADEMLKMGFIEDIEWILEHTPMEKQVALFSATMPSAIRKVADTYLKNSEEITIQSRTRTVESIEQKYWFASGAGKTDALVRILEFEQFDAAIIFVRTKNATLELAERLEAEGHACAAMNGDLTQDLRERTINRLKDGGIDIIVATDVAARGLDVERISHVFNYDIPFDTEAYVHRIGRTGRAGRKGTAILFVSSRERGMLRSIEKATRQPIKEFQLPSVKDVTSKRIEVFKKQLMATMRQENLSFYADIIHQLLEEEETASIEEIAAGLCFLAQKESPLVVKEIKSKKKGKSERDHREPPSGRRGGGRRERRRDRHTSRAEPRGRNTEAGMRSYRIEVGRRHGVNPGSIVATIAEKAGIQGKRIGRIELYDKYSTVDLPEGMSRNAFHVLKRAYLSNRPMKISEVK